VFGRCIGSGGEGVGFGGGELRVDEKGNNRDVW